MTIDILQEVINESMEEKKIFKMKIIVFICIFSSILIISIMLIVSWYNNHINNMIYDDASKIYKTINKIDKAIVIHNIKERDSQILLLDKYFHDSKTSYSAIAGFYLANFARLQHNYSKAIYYYNYIQDNKILHDSIRSYAALNGVSANISYGNISRTEAIEKIAKYTQVENTLFTKTLNTTKYYIFIAYDNMIKLIGIKHDEKYNKEKLNNINSLNNKSNNSNNGYFYLPFTILNSIFLIHEKQNIEAIIKLNEINNTTNNQNINNLIKSLIDYASITKLA